MRRAGRRLLFRLCRAMRSLRAAGIGLATSFLRRTVGICWFRSGRARMSIIPMIIRKSFIVRMFLSTRRRANS